MAFVSATNVNCNWSAAPLTITRPAGATTGRILLAVCFAYEQTPSNTFSVPTGWTRVPSCSYSNGFDVAVDVFYRVVQAGDGSTDSFDVSQRSISGWILQLVYDTTTVVSASNAQHNTASTSVVAPSIVATSGDTWLAIFVGQESSQSPFSTASGMTERFDAGNAGQGGSIAVDDQVLGASGATGTSTSTGSASQPSFGISIALTTGAAVLTEDMPPLKRPRPGRGPYSLGRYYRPIGETGPILIGARAFFADMAEAPSIADLIAATVAFAAAETESSTLTDAVAATAAFSSAEAESLTITDASTSGQAFAGADAEAITLTDASSAAAAFAGSEAESLTAAEAAAATAGFQAAEAEVLTAADAVARAGANAFTDAIAEGIATAGGAYLRRR